MRDTFFFFFRRVFKSKSGLGFWFCNAWMHKASFKSLCAMLRAVEVAHTTDKMIKKAVKHDGHRFKSPCLPEWPGWYVMVYFLYFTPESRGLIALKATRVLDKGIRTRLGSTRQGQVKDLCSSSIYLCCCAFGLRVVLCVTEHHLILASCEIRSTLRMNL